MYKEADYASANLTSSQLRRCQCIKIEGAPPVKYQELGPASTN
jgi:hypothetical protein